MTFNYGLNLFQIQSTFSGKRQEYLPKDYDLLEKVKTGNGGQKGNLSPCFNYHIALDSFRSLFNIGSVIRMCDAAGFTSVLLGNGPKSDHPSIQRTARVLKSG
jgi:tRNA G18 (ribose-2'-O)-methylase SpoU